MLSIVLALALAQPISSTSCKTGGNCSLRSLVVGSGANRFLVGSTTGPFGTTLPGFKYSSASTQIGIFNANNASLFTLNLGTGLLNGTSLSLAGYLEFSSGTSGYLSWVGASAPTSLPAAAAVRGFYADNATNRVWRADTVGWSDVQSGAHDVIDAPVYVVDVGQGGGASEWRYAPRTTGAHTPSTLTETCAGGTQIGYTTTGFRGLSRAHRLRQTQALANATCGQQSGALTIASRWKGRFSTHVVTSAGLTTVRIVCGLAEASLFTAPTDAPAIQGYWLRYSTSAGDTAWQLCTGDGATTTCSSTTVAPVLGTSQEIRIDARESAAVSAWVDGVARIRKTTNLPTGSANLVEGCVAMTLGAAVRDVGHTNIVIEGNL